MANIADNYGTSGNFNKRVWLQWQGAGNFTMNWDGNSVTGAAGSASSDDVVELRIIGKGTLASALVNDVAVPNMTDVDMSSLTPNGRVGLGLGIFAH